MKSGCGGKQLSQHSIYHQAYQIYAGMAEKVLFINWSGASVLPELVPKGTVPFGVWSVIQLPT